MGIIISDVSKRYGSVVAISKASMSVEDGEIRAILGGNGSGKSTLAKAVGGIICYDTGKVIFNGKEIHFSSPKEAKKNKVIITSQELSLFENLTVEENICICDVPIKIGFFTNKKEVSRKAYQILETMKLTNLLGKKVSELHPNQQYMVELAKAIVQEPKVLIIDEITSALYRQDVEIVDDILKNLKSQGCIILFISHRMMELYTICDSVTIMRNGETLGTYDMQEKTEDELLSLMVGSTIVSYHGEGKSNTNLYQENISIRVPSIPIKSYQTTESLDISSGEIIGIAGLQGHGQSDLVRSLYGLQGSINVEIDGKQCLISNPKCAVKQGFAFISGNRERDGVFNERDLKENVTAVLELVKNKNVSNAKELLNSYNVRFDNTKQIITKLSGGNQQKVVVARWLSTKPKLLLADDPTKGIDVKAREDLHKEFSKLAKQGSSVIYASSDDDELVNITSMAERSRVIVMYEGQISKTLVGNEITRENISAASMPSKNMQNDLKGM
jgi:ABC-type sugar transport system ATPase subunit